MLLTALERDHHLGVADPLDPTEKLGQALLELKAVRLVGVLYLRALASAAERQSPKEEAYDAEGGKRNGERSLFPF